MAAPKGNQFWKIRSSHGRKPIFESKEQLWDAACEYFQYVDDNPIVSYKAVLGKDGAEQLDQIHIRPYTQGGLCVFLDITQETYIQYRNKEGFSEVCSNIDEIIRDQKFSGATVGIFNSNIIARDLGLKEHSQSDVNLTTHEDALELLK